MTDVIRPSAPSSLPADAEPPANRRSWLGWGLAIFILVACFLFIDIDDLKQTLSNISLAELVFLVLLVSIDRIFMALKWAYLLHLLEVRLPLLRAIRFFYQGGLSGIFMPSQVGGDILRAYWAAKESGESYASYASLVMERLLGLLSALNWAIVGATICAIHLFPTWIWWLIPLGLAGIVTANGVFLLSMHERVHGYVLSFLGRRAGGRVIGILHRFYEAYSRFGNNRTGLAIAMGLTLLEHLLQLVIMLLIARGLGIESNVVLFIAATALYLVVLRLPVAPDGWGIGEAGAIAVYSLIGLAAASAFSISVLWHILVMLAMLPSIFLLITHRDRTDAAEIAAINAERVRIETIEQEQLRAAQERAEAGESKA